MATFILRDELLKILNSRQLTPYFQPVVSLGQERLIGYEALISGPADSPLYSRESLFNAAERFNLSAKLEYICRELSIAKYAERKLKEKLFINISLSALLQPDFKNGVTLKLLQKYGVNPACMVVELTGNYPADDYAAMSEATRHYRDMGFAIAIDDLGCGCSGLRLWAELLPNYVKISKHFINGLDTDTVKYSIVRSIQNIASALNCIVIAEGVETEAEFSTVTELGIGLAQGYYFAKPSAIPLANIDPVLFIKKLDHFQYGLFNEKVAIDIAHHVPPVPSATKVCEVLGAFQRNVDLYMLPLVDDGLVKGMVFREPFLSKLFSSRYGVELHGKKTISQFIDKPPLIVTHNTPIQTVSGLITSSMIEHVPAFIITRDGVYAGVATVLDLLAEVTRQQIQYARYGNPLTLLPGSAPINHYIDELLAGAQPFVVGYFDLDNFKPFNDVYGYNAGDNIIKLVAEILRRYVTSEQGLVGHIGGDDFIVVFVCSHWEQLCESMLKDFAAAVTSYYHEQDREQGGIHAESRSGEKCFFPLISLSIGLVDMSAAGQCKSHVELADLATGAKKQAKKIPGNSYFIDRRSQERVC